MSLWILFNNALATCKYVSSKYYSNCFLDLSWEILLKSKYQPRLGGWCDDRGQCCSYRSKKQSLLYLLTKIHFAIALPCNGTTSYFNGFVAFKKAVCKCLINKDRYFRFCFCCLSVFRNKAISCLTTGYTRKYWSIVKDFYGNGNAG